MAPSFAAIALVGIALLLPAGRAGADPLRIEVRGNIPYPMPLVRATLLDLEAFADWFPALGDWRVLERRGTDTFVYGVQDLPWPLKDRDYVVRYRARDGADGSFELEAVALTDTHGDATRGTALHGPMPAAAPERARRFVRIDRMTTRWRLEPEGAGTAVVYLYDGSIGLPLPGWVARVGWEAQTRVLIEALHDEVARRQDAFQAPH